MAKSLGIVVFGAVFVDIKGYPSGTYIPGGRNAGRVEQVHGGVSRNIVEDIANVELRPTFVSLVDNDGIGAEVLDKLRRHKVNIEYMQSVPNGMGTWLAVFDHKGEVQAAISKRPDLTPVMTLLEEKGDEIFENADSIALEIDMDKDIVKKIFKLAEKHNKRVYAVVSNMSIAADRRDFIKKTDCFVCNRQEAGILFMDNYEDKTIDELKQILLRKVISAEIPCMIVTLGDNGAVYATADGQCGYSPARKVTAKDTTGAGDAFFAGVTIGLTYGKTLAKSCEIGAQLAASVIVSLENVCPRFLPAEFELEARD
ncbi:MAG: carbohydrate kinase family protein [Lachnospiraceae bacterium]|jgi:pseudouridine kinase|nr:carbohydrate kinase family protein [Lachnospiraceae bacterium]MCR5428298.1 carbohydrate kinase family protein [Lachnospiraceae bacterium]